MKYRPSKGFLVCMLALAAAGGASAWAWQRAHRQTPRGDGSLASFILAVKQDANPFVYTDWERRKELQPATDAALASLESEFPALKVEKRQVPVEQNGFVQLRYLVGGNSLIWFPRTSPLMDVVMDRAGGDEDIRKALDGEAEMVERLEKVAAMAQWSSLDLPPGDFWFVPTRSHIHAGKILLAKARLAARDGDEAEALRLVGLVRNLADRFHDLDAPNLQTETVSLSLENSLQETVVKEILPAIGKGADLNRWQPLIGRERRYEPGELAKVMRGEFQTVARGILLPMILDERNQLRPDDGMTVARAYAASFDQWVKSMNSAEFKNLQAAAGLEPAENAPGLSTEGRSILKTLFVGSQAWSKGFVRMSYRAGLNHTVLELVAAEQKGERAEERGKELDGGTYVFDSSRRMVSLSATIAVPGVKPVALPW